MPQVPEESLNYVAAFNWMRPFLGAQASRLPMKLSNRAAKMAALPRLSHVKTAIDLIWKNNRAHALGDSFAPPGLQEIEASET
jgi:hypothetical protein